MEIFKSKMDENVDKNMKKGREENYRQQKTWRKKWEKFEDIRKQIVQLTKNYLLQKQITRYKSKNGMKSIGK